MLRADPVGPRITYYDDATGERIELSAVTLANWAAKTGNRPAGRRHRLCDRGAGTRRPDSSRTQPRSGACR
ncbi:TIGR03089 family protein [Mycobacterium tuberculosis]|uniref:TIGR03089 family protein n=1 Tax=Mycobacterium tuberculosis TaxID=1773 RepID=A0A655ILU2_MYCTX|nr:TIGR03089 family protein [Mycobacterium tuberculosis]